MKRCVLPQIWAVLIAITLCLFHLPAAAAQQDAEAPAEETSPTADDTSEIAPEDAPDSTMQENDESAEPEPPDPAEEAFQRAMQHDEKNELEEAIADCTEAIRLGPDNIEYLNARAHLYREMRNSEKALADAAKVLELDPTNVQARALRGTVFELSGDTDKALIEFNTAVEQNPTSVQALSERQKYFVRQGQKDKAAADADRMVQLQPDSANANVARALSAATDEQRINYASTAIQQDPENWAAYKLRGLARAATGDFAAAKSDFEKALELSPDNSLVLSARGAMYYMQGEFEKSLADSQRAADLEPRNCTILALLADRLATCPDSNLRNATKAAEYAAKALRLNANEPLVWRACASAAAINGNFEEAQKWQLRLLNSNVVPPDEKAEHQQRLLAYRSRKPYRGPRPSEDNEIARKRHRAVEAVTNKNFDLAVALFSEVIATDSKNAFAYFGRAYAYDGQDKDDLAIEDFSRAIELEPNEFAYYNGRAILLRKTKQYAKAADDWLIVEKLDTKDEKRVRNTLAWLFATCPDESVRDADKAAEYVDRALELKPDDGATWDTCAAVFAANGEFDEAVEWEKAYLDRTDVSDQERDNGRKRLELYEQHQPYREELKPDEQLTASITPTPPGK